MKQKIGQPAAVMCCSKTAAATEVPEKLNDSNFFLTIVYQSGPLFCSLPVLFVFVFVVVVIFALSTSKVHASLPLFFRSEGLIIIIRNAFPMR